jgi:hypothetical protein
VIYDRRALQCSGPSRESQGLRRVCDGVDRVRSHRVSFSPSIAPARQVARRVARNEAEGRGQRRSLSCLHFSMLPPRYDIVLL